MAPKRKQPNADDGSVATTVTRTSARLANVKAKTKVDAAAVAPPAAKPEPNKRKKAKTTTAKSQPQEEDGAVEAEVLDGSKTIIIEHCKQCNSFKTRAIQVKNGVEKGVGGVKVVLNPEKPRRGCFEIREEGGETFVSLLDMKRPFKPMKELDMEQVIADIVEKIK